MKSIKFGIIGCGAIAKKHIHCLKSHGCQIAALCDQDLQKAKQLSLSDETKLYVDYFDMINEVNLDVVLVLTPSGSHHKIVCDISKFGLHIIVEKPIALRIDHANEMIYECEMNGSTLTVVKQNRFNQPIKLAKRLINDGYLGKLFLGTIRVRWTRSQEYYDKDAWRGTWKNDGGVIANQAIHHIDMLQWFLGDVESVVSRNANALLDIEAEDTSVSLVNFKSGALGVIEATSATRPKDIEGSISLLGSKGSIVIDGFAMNNMSVLNLEDETILKGSKEFMANPDDFAYSHMVFYSDFLNNLNSNNPQLVSGIEALKSLEIVHAIYNSHHLRKEIFIDKNLQNSNLGL